MIFFNTTQKTTQKILNDNQNKILSLVKNNSHITRNELVDELGITSDGVKYNLNKLKQLNIIERIGPDKGGYWKSSQIIIFYIKNKKIMIRLEKINAKNIWNILKLKISDEQMEFVASNDLSIIETYIAIISNGHAFPFGIFLTAISTQDLSKMVKR